MSGRGCLHVWIGEKEPWLRSKGEVTGDRWFTHLFALTFKAKVLQLRSCQAGSPQGCYQHYFASSMYMFTGQIVFGDD